ncbi:MAG: VWA domain-containing protein [Gammaproteobacteria bacterium]|nr:VWA domain-containing protein [Gammaproteobacteria bacterium]
MKNRREIEGISLSFLDTIACGFGAIILLLVIVKITEPIVLEEATVDYQGKVRDLQQQLFEIRGEVKVLNRELDEKQQQLSREQRRLARLQGDVSSISGEYKASTADSSVANIIAGKLASARQDLTEEMQRLKVSEVSKSVNNQLVAGIPVDSEYIIFIIDTSGSMYNYAWNLAVRKMEETLDVHPKVKGIQIMNDMGNYMFSRYANRWIPDTPARRKAIVERMRTWNSFSNSSPVEGITKAINAFYAPDKKISLYVFGDEFSGRSIQSVVDRVDLLNRKDADGKRRVRIHAIGFPTIFSQAPQLQATGIRFAILMRALCERNDGTFVGLENFR